MSALLRIARPLAASSSSLLPSVLASTAGAARRAYHEKVIDHYQNPRNVGKMNKADADVGTGLVGAPACGDVMQLQLRLGKDGKTIEDAVFKTFGCGSAIASRYGEGQGETGREVSRGVMFNFAFSFRLLFSLLHSLLYLVHVSIL